MAIREDFVRSRFARARARLNEWRHDGVMWRKFAYAGAAEFPEWFRRYTPPLFGTAFFMAVPRARDAVIANQARMLGVQPDSLAARRAAHKVYTQFAHCLTDALEMSGKPDRLFAREYVNVHYFQQSRARGRGVILVTAHTGSWEVGGRLLKLTRDIRTTMVMAKEANSGTRSYVDDLRKRSGVDVVYASGNDPSTALTLLTRLRANEIVAIQVDRPPPSSNVIETRLFGARWIVPEGPFRLAQASGAPIVPVFLRRSGYRKYTFHLERPIEVGRQRTAETLRDAAQHVTTALETFVQTYPDQWFHFEPIPD